MRPAAASRRAAIAKAATSVPATVDGRPDDSMPLTVSGLPEWRVMVRAPADEEGGQQATARWHRQV
ncbi:hypothetical protein ACIRP2_02660 [Streptomyces sp. NPDC101194]|uniref:hypothetical protein n=1 Tax=Streptomyces sp. NPDC101194 TaxID=3366127 RepID=UPI0037FCDECF